MAIEEKIATSEQADTQAEWFARAMNMPILKAKNYLKHISGRWGGCNRCVFSTPRNSWIERGCFKGNNTKICEACSDFTRIP